MPLCCHCNAIDITTLVWDTPDPQMYKAHHRTFREFKQSAESCPLCALFVEELEKRNPHYDYDQTYEAGDLRGIYYRGQHESPRIRIKETDPKFLTGLIMNCQNFSVTVDICANEDSVAATAQDVSGRPIRPVGDFRRAKGWIQYCLDNHSRCTSRALNSQNPSIKSDWRPTRVVDVGPIDGSREPRLICDSGNFGQYVTLSHCWGNAVTVKTTTETLPAHKQQIPLVGLTRTFRDAVIITRNLGFSYLWIDSLCIIQDDPKDWETESARMADIYGNSAVTIAASSSENSQVGCFFSRDTNPTVALNYPSSNRPAGVVYVTRPSKGFEETVNSGPLNRRAWVFQERLLSRRILHYGKDQLHWECQETCLSENGHEVLAHHYYKSDSILSSTTISASHQVEQSSLYKDWYEMVETYTQRRLTRDSDKFPALSGLVNVFARLSGDRYVAGLWERDLMVGLLWRASYSEQPRLQRPPVHRAPSWSWAALEGGILFDSDVSYRHQQIAPRGADFALSDLDIAIQLAGSDPFGMVASGTMTVSGRLKQVEYRVVSESLEYYYSPMANMSDPLYSDGEKIGTAFFDEAGTRGQLYCLEVCTSYLNNEERTVDRQLALILKPIGTDEKYCRVGTASLSPPFGPAKRNDWFYDVPRRRITIL